MINANADSVADALKVGNEFKKAVNDRYKLLEIDIDGIFRRILLQAKKKYAAVSLVEHDGQWVEKMEVKGLDMKRREYCALSKEVSARLLQEILSGNDSEVSVARMHEYLRDVAAKMRAGEIPLVKYTIFTQLGKAPKEYPNADSMPQVQVALRELARGKTVRRGDVIGYIITGDGQSSEPAPKRAYTPADVRTEPGLAPDVEWYIGKQIFPPVERLCANIVGTSTMQLGEQLGLDVKKYSAFNTAQGGGGGGGNDAEMHPLESQVADEVRFGECTRIAFACRACKASTPFEGLVGSAEGVVTPDGIACGACGALAAMHTLAAQLEHAVRAETTRYYEGWVVCDDPSCGNRTRQIGVYGTRCLGPKGLGRECLGRMRYQYSEKAVYTQLVYMAGLFDVDRARAKVAGEVPDATVAAMAQEGKDRIVALAAQNRVRFGTLKDVVDRYLDKCGRQWVAMDSLFARLGFLKT
jgi:DNA polymerase alpha subunit A